MTNLRNNILEERRQIREKLGRLQQGQREFDRSIEKDLEAIPWHQRKSEGLEMAYSGVPSGVLSFTSVLLTIWIAVCCYMVGDIIT